MKTHSAQHVPDSAERGQPSQQQEICRDQEFPGWRPGETNPQNSLGILGKKLDFLQHVEWGLQPLYSSISGNSDPSNQRT